MRAPISVIIPTLNAAPHIGPLLASLGAGLAAGLISEVIISDGGSSDDIKKVADLAGARFVVGAAGRGVQLAAGAATARGKWLLFVHADCQFAPDWALAVTNHLASSDTPAYFKLAFDAKGFGARWVSGWANFRSRVFKLPYGDQGLLIRRIDYNAAGGFANLPLMEDVALIRRLQTIHGLPSTITTSAVRYQRQGWLRRGMRNLWCLARYLLGGDPEKIARSYRR